MSGVKRVEFFAYLDDDVAEIDHHDSEDGPCVWYSDYAALEAERERDRAQVAAMREHAEMFVWLRDKCRLFEHYRAIKWRPNAFEHEVREQMKKDAALQAKPTA